MIRAELLLQWSMVGGHVMLWGVFSGKDVGPLIEIHGWMNGFIYKNILQDHMPTFWKKIYDYNYLFQHNSDPNNTFKLVHFAQKILRFEISALTPNLNP